MWRRGGVEKEDGRDKKFRRGHDGSGRCFGLGLFLEAIECSWVNPENFGSDPLVPTGFFEDFGNVFVLHFLERLVGLRPVLSQATPWISQKFWQIVGHQGVMFGHDDGSFDRVFQLPDIPGPVIRQQPLSTDLRKTPSRQPVSPTQPF